MSSRFRDDVLGRGLGRRPTIGWLVPVLALALALGTWTAKLRADEPVRCHRTTLARVSGEKAPALRVCADPNNLPFSNAQGAGLENRLAELVARELGMRVEYTFHAQRRGFFRNTLKAQVCDVVMGVPVDVDMAATTKPYYRSTYTFVTRAERNLDIASFDDERLRTLRVGVHLVGDDFANPPPVEALARRGIRDNVVGFTVYGDYARPSPPAELVTAVRRGDVDVAVVWGPLAGYESRQHPGELRVTNVTPREGDPPMAFSVGIGVRRRDVALREKLDAVLERRRVEVQALLKEFGVPRAPERG